MQRHALGIIALVSLVLGVAGILYYGTNDSQTSLMASMCMRIGLVIGALWLALPQFKRMSGGLPTWAAGIVVLCLAIVIARPRTIVVLGPILLVLAGLAAIGWLLKPPESNRKR